MLGLNRLRKRFPISKDCEHSTILLRRYLTGAISENPTAAPTITHYGSVDAKQTESFSNSWFESDHIDKTKKLRGEIIRLFSTTPKTEQLEEFVNTRLQDCRNLELAQLLHFWGKKSARNHHASMRNHLPAMAALLSKLSISNWTFGEISSMMYGLQCLREKTDGVLPIIEIMTKASVESLKADANPAPKNISMILLGLQKNTFSTVISRKFITVLTSMVMKRKEPFGPQSIGNALYGLQGMSSEFYEVRTLIASLSTAVEESKGHLAPQEIGNSLYGLQE